MTGSEFYAYVLRLGFKRTDKETEVYEAITDGVGEMMRRFGFIEAQEDKNTTDTISVLGDFKLSLESDFGTVVSVSVEDGTNADPLSIIPKEKFDALYPDINVTADRGYPQHACVFDSSIYLGPIPDQTSYTYRISYSKKGSAVTSATASVQFSVDYRDILADNVLARLYKGLGEADMELSHRNSFEAGMVWAERRERKNQGAGTFAQIQRDC